MMFPLVIAFFCGDVVFTMMALAMGCLAFLELKGAFAKKEINISAFAAGMLMATLILKAFGFFAFLNFAVLAVMVSFVLATLLVLQKQSPIDVAASILSLLYAFVPFWVLADLYSENVYLSILVFVISFSTDIFAYLSGKFFGKHKLIPKVSPNKTVEGSVGGTLCCVGICALYLWIVKLPILQMLPICLFGSLASQLGDLFASSIKRYCGIKDFGKLIPGHGGILDRFDSVIFVSLFVSVFV